MMSGLDAAAFEAHFLHYVQAVACKAIGDSAQYTKHLQRRSAEGDAAALAQTAALEFFAGLEARVYAAVEEMRTLGQDRVARVCDAVGQAGHTGQMRMDGWALPFAPVQRWALCELTGMSSGRVLDVGGLSLALEFEAFTTALWLVRSMATLERARASEFANKAGENAAIAAIVTEYCERQAEHAAAGRTYEWAFDVTFKTLRVTQECLNVYMQEVERVRGV
jgi:uncharacterized membrane protein